MAINTIFNTSIDWGKYMPRAPLAPFRAGALATVLGLAACAGQGHENGPRTPNQQAATSGTDIRDFVARDNVAAYPRGNGRVAIGQMEITKADISDTLHSIARDNNLGFVEILSANPTVSSIMPGAGREVVIPGLHLLPRSNRDGIVVNLADMRLYVFNVQGQATHSYPVGIGRQGLETPEGITRITRKRYNPQWRPTERMRTENPRLPEVVPPGPNNPLGEYALNLGWPAYLIHGTNDPGSVGRRTSSGCIRLYPEDIAPLFSDTPVSTPVQVVDQSVKAGWISDKFYVEAHATQDMADTIEQRGYVPRLSLSSSERVRIEQAAGEYADRLDWDHVEGVVSKRRGYPVPVFTR